MSAKETAKEIYQRQIIESYTHSHTIRNSLAYVERIPPEEIKIEGLDFWLNVKEELKNMETN